MFTDSQIRDAVEMQRLGIDRCWHEPIVDGMCYCVEKTRLECWCGYVCRAPVVDGKLDRVAQELIWNEHQKQFKCGPWVNLQ